MTFIYYFYIHKVARGHNLFKNLNIKNNDYAYVVADCFDTFTKLYIQLYKNVYK